MTSDDAFLDLKKELLVDFVKILGIKGYSGKNKSQLIDLIEDYYVQRGFPYTCVVCLEDSWMLAFGENLSFGYDDRDVYRALIPHWKKPDRAYIKNLNPKVASAKTIVSMLGWILDLEKFGFAFKDYTDNTLILEEDLERRKKTTIGRRFEGLVPKLYHLKLAKEQITKIKSIENILNRLKKSQYITLQKNDEKRLILLINELNEMGRLKYRDYRRYLQKDIPIEDIPRWIELIDDEVWANILIERGLTLDRTEELFKRGWTKEKLTKSPTGISEEEIKELFPEVIEEEKAKRKSELDEICEIIFQEIEKQNAEDDKTKIASIQMMIMQRYNIKDLNEINYISNSISERLELDTPKEEISEEEEEFIKEMFELGYNERFDELNKLTKEELLEKLQNIQNGVLQYHQMKYSKSRIIYDIITLLEAQFESETGKKAFWGGKETQAFKEWIESNEKRESETTAITFTSKDQPLEEIESLNVKILKFLDYLDNYSFMVIKGISLSQRKIIVENTFPITFE